MAKEKNFNPVQEQKKADKQKQLRKQKATVQAQRNEKLARRNPARIQRDIDVLKEAEQNEGTLRPHERTRLSELEKDLVAVNKARTALGDKAPQFKPERTYNDGDRGGDRGGRGGRGGHRGGNVLGKRTRDGGWKGRDGEESSDTDADVKDIPMPRDTPPPLPRRPHRFPHAEDAPPPEPKKAVLVYEAAPQVRDLRKEAVKFMPASVAQKMKLAKGEGRMLEPEEFDKLEREGYMNVAKPVGETKPDDDESPVGTGTPLVPRRPADITADEELLAFMEQQAAEGNSEGADAALRENSRVMDRYIGRGVELEEIEDDDS
ncbi:hypothetical protein K504DRAFT_464768 [Pleomassaria siparia CBS 279.74]|uniref:Wbp11/ELF5/Saf1 N-terminal domain-containing protein n=1 Tax=Pleomassaria siparia CBS 279.74 TaxID=1314801 RepID=A0A6G1KJI1_9PLEO|nr:hypothetical protein K504DRAFT_464768 [Pleomassaria siparia CBS 279.74]